MFKVSHLNIPNLPSFNAVILTDLHVGSPLCTLNYLRKLVKEINNLKPDFVFLLGDITNYDIHKFVINGKVEPLSECLFTLNELRPKHLTLAVDGNHEHMLGISEYFKIISLCNNIIDISNKTYLFNFKNNTKIKFVGLADPHLAEESFLLKCADTLRDAFVLSHSPSNFLKLDNYKNNSYTYGVCGHTHNMQGFTYIKNIFSKLPTQKFKERFPAFYTKSGHNSTGKGFYLSPGIGTSGLPIRFDKPKVDFLVFN